MVAGAGEGHGEKHRIEAGKPVSIDRRIDLGKIACQDAVVCVQEHIAGHERHAGVDERGHVAEPQDLRALDVKVFGQKDDRDPHHIDGDDQQDGQLQRVPHKAGHVAGKEELDHDPVIRLSRRVLRGKDAGQGVQARHQHESEEQVGKKQKAEDLEQKARVYPFLLLHTSSPL